MALDTDTAMAAEFRKLISAVRRGFDQRGA